jgi:hypothetical protein
MAASKCLCTIEVDSSRAAIKAAKVQRIDIFSGTKLINII